MRTRITDLLWIEYPIIQGAMARIADASLAAAVSETGGLGIIACGGAKLDWIRQQVERARSLTSKPIGANVMLMDPQAEEVAKLLAELKIEVITTGAGSPGDYLPLWKEAGIKVIPVVATTSLARRMERLGVDAVVAEGTESGGHVGELTTMALVPSVCEAVSIPVLAAGGIADGRGMCAAFALGAEGVQMGTRFLTVEECTVCDPGRRRCWERRTPTPSSPVAIPATRYAGSRTSSPVSAASANWPAAIRKTWKACMQDRCRGL